MDMKCFQMLYISKIKKKPAPKNKFSRYNKRQSYAGASVAAQPCFPYRFERRKHRSLVRAYPLFKSLFPSGCRKSSHPRVVHERRNEKKK